METILKFIGFDPITSIVIEPTLTAEPAKEAALHRAQDAAHTIAAQF